MLIPIQASTQLMGHAALTSHALDEAVTAFNSELAQAFQPAGQLIGIPAAGISNLVRLDATGAVGPLAVVSATVALAVVTDDDPQRVHDLAGGFTSTRFPATTFDILTREQLERLQGLGDFANAHAAALRQAAGRITDIAAGQG